MKAWVLALTLAAAGPTAAQSQPPHITVGDPAIELAIHGSECEVTREDLSHLAPSADIEALERTGDLRVLAVLYPCLAVQRLRASGDVPAYTGHAVWMQLAPSVTGVSRSEFIAAMASQFAIPSDQITPLPFNEAQSGQPTFFARDENGIYGVMLAEQNGTPICSMVGMTIVNGRGYARYDYRPCFEQSEMTEFGLRGWSAAAELLRRTPEHQFSTTVLPAPQRSESVGERLLDAGARGAGGGLIFGLVVVLVGAVVALMIRQTR